MSPKERRRRLLEYLEIIDKWVTIKDLANNLGISERTIHSDIQKLNEELQAIDSIIEKRRGVGVRLVNKFQINRQHLIDVENAITDRKTLILARLLINSETITYQGLTEEFFVSITSIKNDLEDIRKQLLNNTSVKLESNTRGTKIVGSELEVREALSWFNQEILTNLVVIRSNNLEEMKKIFQQFYGDKIVNVSYDILLSFVKQNNSLLSDYYIFNTLNTYIIQLSRLLDGHSLSDKMLEIENEEFKDLEKFTLGASQLLTRASSRLDFKYTDTEISFLSKYLILNRFEEFPNAISHNQFIEQLIVHLSDALYVDFSQDRKLLAELKQHVPPMIFRLKLGIKVENPFVSQIKTEYPQTFRTIMLAISKFETEYKLNFNDDEVALLAIYFQSAIEKQKLNRRVLVVCQYGIATSELLVNRLRNELGSQEIIESASVGELEFFDLSNYDLIISSTDSVHGENIINVSPFVNNSEISRIKNILNSSQNLNKDSEVKIENIIQFLDARYVIESAQFENRECLLKCIGEQLIQDDFIEEPYIDSLIHRETLGSTDLPEGIATPHGDTNFVKKSLIVVINNNTKIKWNKYFVDKVFILLISKDDTSYTKKIIKELYTLIKDEYLLKNFKEYLVEVKEELRGDS